MDNLLQDEDEDYWAASSATKIKSNVNLFDDSVVSKLHLQIKHN